MGDSRLPRDITLPRNLMMEWRRGNEHEFVVIERIQSRVGSSRVTTHSIISIIPMKAKKNKQFSPHFSVSLFASCEWCWPVRAVFDSPWPAQLNTLCEQFSLNSLAPSRRYAHKRPCPSPVLLHIWTTATIAQVPVCDRRNEQFNIACCDYCYRRFEEMRSSFSCPNGNCRAVSNANARQHSGRALRAIKQL